MADVVERLRAQELNWKRISQLRPSQKVAEWCCNARSSPLGLLRSRFLRGGSETSADHDVIVLTRRMPKSMFTHQQDGIDENDGLALSLVGRWWVMPLFSRTGGFFCA